MPYQMVRDADYPGTGLPVYKVYDAEDYDNPMVQHPRPIGEVWGTGVAGVVPGKFIPTGVRWDLAGHMTLDDSNLLPAGAYADAARAMVAAYEGS